MKKNPVVIWFAMFSLVACALLFIGNLLRQPADTQLAATAAAIEGPAQATATAIAVQVRAFSAQVDAVNGYRVSTFWSIFTPSLIFVTACIAVLLAIRIVNVRVEVYRARNMPAAFSPAPGAVVEHDTITVNTPAGSYQLDRREDAYALVSRLLRAAMEKAGPESQRIPGWRELPGWTSDRWVEAVKLLGGAVTATPGKGTFCAGGYDIKDLWVSVARRDIPLPYSGDGQ